jgi:hypothetical protein
VWIYVFEGAVIVPVGSNVVCFDRESAPRTSPRRDFERGWPSFQFFHPTASGTPPSSQSAFCRPALRLSKLSEKQIVPVSQFEYGRTKW